MHPLFTQADALTGEIIAAAIEVHRDKGPGLIESSYMKLLDVPIGLLINCHTMRLTDGVHRLILLGANS